MIEVAYLLFFLVVLTTGAVAMRYSATLSTHLPRLINIGAGFIFALIFLHMLPETYQHGEGFRAGYWIILGFLIQVILEVFSGGLEHGHIHQTKGTFPLAIFISLSLHSLLEGMPVLNHDHGHGHTHDLDWPLIGGILLHKLPITILLVTLLIRSGVSKGRTWMALIVFGLTMPLGSLLNWLLIEKEWAHADGFVTASMGLVVGILLHISTTIVFEQDRSHQFNRVKFTSVLIGLILGALSITLL